MADSHIRHGSALAADVLVAAFADNTALGPPIYWCPFFVVGVIGLTRPIMADGLQYEKGGGD